MFAILALLFRKSCRCLITQLGGCTWGNDVGLLCSVRIKMLENWNLVAEELHRKYFDVASGQIDWRQQVR